MVAVEVCANMAQYGLLKTLKEQRGMRPDTAFRCNFLVRVAVLCVSERPKAVAVARSHWCRSVPWFCCSEPIWILRAIEAEAHAIPQNGWIPGCGAENRTTNRGLCVFIRRMPIRRRVRADPSEPCFQGEILANLHSRNFDCYNCSMVTSRAEWY